MTDPQRQFDLSLTAFEASCTGTQLRKRFLLAGKTIEVRFANAHAAQILEPAFRHLDTDGKHDADLTICCWDHASLGEVPPHEPANGVGLEYQDGPIRILRSLTEQTIHAYDMARGLALFHAPDISRTPAWAQAAPFRPIFHWWAGSLGMQLLHAAAIGNESGGVLLIGQGGSGKSTTALASVGSALKYAADDYCLVSPEPHAFTAHSLYSSGKADGFSIASIPALAEAFKSTRLSQDQKRIVFLDQWTPSSLIRSFHIKALVAPKVRTGEITAMSKLSLREALLALGPSTLFQIPGDRPQSLARISELVRRVPSYRLTIGGPPSEAISAIRDLLGAPVAREPKHA